MTLILKSTLMCNYKKLFHEVMDKYNYTCIYSHYTYNYTSMNKAIVTHIRIDHIHIFCKQSHLHSFKCYIQLKVEKI